MMEWARGSWGMLGGKGFEANGGGALALWCMEEVRSNVAVWRAGSQNQISQLPTFDKSGEGPARHRGRTQPENLQLHPANILLSESKYSFHKLLFH